METNGSQKMVFMLVSAQVASGEVGGTHLGKAMLAGTRMVRCPAAHGRTGVQ